MNDFCLNIIRQLECTGKMRGCQGDKGIRRHPYPVQQPGRMGRVRVVIGCNGNRSDFSATNQRGTLRRQIRLELSGFHA